MPVRPKGLDSKWIYTHMKEVPVRKEIRNWSRRKVTQSGKSSKVHLTPCSCWEELICYQVNPNYRDGCGRIGEPDAIKQSNNLVNLSWPIPQCFYDLTLTERLWSAWVSFQSTWRLYFSLWFNWHSGLIHWSSCKACQCISVSPNLIKFDLGSW